MQLTSQLVSVILWSYEYGVKVNYSYG